MFEKLEGERFGRRSPFVQADINLTQIEAWLQPEGLWIISKELPQFLVSGLTERHDLISQKLQLLAHATADNGIALLQAHGRAFPVGNFFAQVITQQALVFLWRRRPLPGTAEHVHQVFLLAPADENLIFRLHIPA